jgi:hypothetical protein
VRDCQLHRDARDSNLWQGDQALAGNAAKSQSRRREKGHRHIKTVDSYIFPTPWQAN